MRNEERGNRPMKTNPSQEYINFICNLYNDTYDDREEDSRPGGESWEPGVKARHKSLAAFKRELEEQGIKLSTSKILKILITGGCWTTERTREVAELFEEYTRSAEVGGEGMSKDAAIKEIADELEISVAMVCMSLPYDRVVYDLENKSSNARRCDRAREKRKNGGEWRLELWQKMIDHAGEKFRTNGRGSRPEVEFTYSISVPGGPGGRKYGGPKAEGYGNEMRIINASGERRNKSISRSTVELAYTRYREIMEENGFVKGPKALGIPGAGSYLYPVIKRIVEAQDSSMKEQRESGLQRMVRR